MEFKEWIPVIGIALTGLFTYLATVRNTSIKLKELKVEQANERLKAEVDEEKAERLREQQEAERLRQREAALWERMEQQLALRDQRIINLEKLLAIETAKRQALSKEVDELTRERDGYKAKYERLKGGGE